MIRRVILNITLIVGLTVSALGFGVGIVNAGEEGVGFTITPPIFELKANPGDQLNDVISIYNNGSKGLDIYTVVENLKPIGEKGQVQIVFDEDEPLPSLKSWITIENSDFSVGPGETENIPFKINVPGNAEPGGHFVSILFGTTQNEMIGGSGSKVSQKIGSLVFITVAGDVTEDAKIIEFTADKGLYLTTNDYSFKTRIKNSGNVYIRPRGFLVITNIFGSKVDEVEIDGKNILPNATREIPIEYSNKKLFGPYTATLSLIYGGSNKTLNSSVGFTVIPWIPTTIVIVVLLVLLILRKRLWKAMTVLLGKSEKKIKKE